MKRLIMALVLGVFSIATRAAPIYFSGTGNWYEVITPSADFTWTEAKVSAESMSFAGAQGYLASVTSQAENDFIWFTLGGAAIAGYHLGGFQTPCTPEPSCGWQWVSGEAWSYTNWALGEPNNVAAGTENSLGFHGNNDWNDRADYKLFPGFIVEYTPVPIPATAWLFASALGLLAWLKRPTN